MEKEERKISRLEKESEAYREQVRKRGSEVPEEKYHANMEQCNWDGNKSNPVNC